MCSDIYGLPEDSEETEKKPALKKKRVLLLIKSWWNNRPVLWQTVYPIILTQREHHFLWTMRVPEELNNDIKVRLTRQ
jgi:hypothetical protein